MAYSLYRSTLFQFQNLLESFQNSQVSRVLLISNLGAYVPRLLYNKTNRRAQILNLFWYETVHVSVSSSAHHQELSTVHSALAHVIHV